MPLKYSGWGLPFSGRAARSRFHLATAASNASPLWKDHAFSQVEGIAPAICRYAPAVCQSGEKAAAAVHLHQSLENIGVYHPVDGRCGVGRGVQPRRLCRLAHRQGAAFGRFQGKSGGSNDNRGEDQEKESEGGFHLFFLSGLTWWRTGLPAVAKAVVTGGRRPPGWMPLPRPKTPVSCASSFLPHVFLRLKRVV